MNKKQRRNLRKNLGFGIILTFTLLVLVFGFYLYKAKLISPLAEVAGPSLTLDPASNTVTAGSTFDVKIILNTDGQISSAVDIFSLNYDPQYLEVQDSDPAADGIQIQPGGLFPIIEQNIVDSATGKINYFTRKNVDGSGTFSGANTLATITFKALKDGAANVDFNFTAAQTNDCNIWLDNADFVDILAGVVNGAYTIGSGGTPPTPTEPPATTPPGGGGGGTKTTPPTPTPTPETPTPAPVETATQEETGTTNETILTPESVSQATPTPTSIPSSVAVASPTPQKTQISKLDLPIVAQDDSSGDTSVGGVAVNIGDVPVTLKYIWILYFGVPILLTGLIYYFWFWKRRKTDSGEDENNI